ncbi:hypothetical protein CQA49_08940 [Helicobacter sp. MIT 00-7814]|uniref:hypothetical protein n=1 Tax=unclassified Helicobacter TaxID=2593540 RepID=UPI000E1E6778|nr:MULTISPECIES: hypothetical protein [unclassified Helicobacter]RDU51954.1 hypothetical protein CQA49_08940 [Helicobacter sp. MIT 00-7814]RDU54124.1 hypothetical protein CQA37_05795 [Helicobacter sp. MIT 99-10781]
MDSNMRTLYKEKNLLTCFILGSLTLMLYAIIAHHDNAENLIAGLLLPGFFLIIFCVGLRSTLKAIKYYEKYYEEQERKMAEERKELEKKMRKTQERRNTSISS